jgi:hypothetical protein
MPKRTIAEEEALVADIQTRFAAGETLTAIQTRYPKVYTLGELKQIVHGTDPKVPVDDQPTTGSRVAPKPPRR